MKAMTVREMNDEIDAATEEYREKVKELRLPDYIKRVLVSAYAEGYADALRNAQ